MNVLRCFAVAALAICASSVNAQNSELANVACEGCSLQQMEQAALSEIDVGGVVVFSVSTGDIRKFIITWDRSLHEAPIDQPLEDYFVALVRFWHENGGTLEMNYYVSSSSWDTSARVASSTAGRSASLRSDAPVPTTIYEALQNPAKMNTVMERLDASWAARGYLAYNTFANSVVLKFLNAEAGQPVAVLNFSDGSRSKATYDLNEKTWKPIPGTGRDVHGNFVPEKKEDFVKEGQPTVYEFPGGWASNAYMDFSRYAFDYGIRLDFREGDTSMICTYESDDIRTEVKCMGIR